ncbi:hypothetical protein B5E58_07435 [Tyzzerella sp. An114]|uniref:ABC transporter permease n=1 Tax=Tyzzerella sp. An114 TaxID=1965545 RepID=UPI000B4473D0|nr:ABC transporter permease subunit [Tyzzerella sp. An114]OUQ58442.1 hypothetical protein B5E58_07435 [Tyzzerella sp. An114]
MKISTIFQNKRFIKISVIFIWILIWQLIYKAVGKEILIVSPFDMFMNLYEKLFKADFWITCFYSVSRILKGYFLGIFLGVITAFISYKAKWFYYFVYPFFSVIKSTPVASFIILALVWIKTDNVPVFIVFIMVMPIVWTNIYEGLIKTDKELIETAFIFEFNIFKKLKYIYIPNLIPYISAACTVSAGLAWKSGIAAEVISSPKISIGSAIYDSKVYLETLELFTWTFTVIIISIILEKIIVYLIKKIFERNLKNNDRT